MSTDEKGMARNLELALRIGAMFLVIYLVVQIVAPFIPALAWAVIISVASYPAYRWLRALIGGRDVFAAVVFTLFALVLLILPAIWLGQSVTEWGTTIAGRISDGTLEVPPPPAKVEQWPLIGDWVYKYWTLASSNLSEAVSEAELQLRAVGTWLLRGAAGVGMDLLQFTLSIIVAGVLLAHADGGAQFARRLFTRFLPGTAADFTALSEQTIRSVAAGVIGVALIQAALIGIGLLAIGVPGAPIWIIVTVFIGIVQLPATLVTIPILIWVWGSQETLSAVLFTIWIVPAGLADSFLKPMLLGRGVEAPMLVIFVGAIGGFILSGIIGLFVGAVILVLAYELFQAWLEEGSLAERAEAEQEDAESA